MSGWATLRIVRSSDLETSCFSSGVPSHAQPDIFDRPVVFLAIDTPRRDPRDIIFVNPEDGTPESFIHKKSKD